MIIQRLDVFFRTKLILDPPNLLNSATNFFFAPLQYVFGQNQYKSLNGKVTEVPKTPDQAAPSTTLKKIAKVFMFILAMIFLPFGSLTRRLSFVYSDVDQAYTIALLSQLPLTDGTQELIESSFAFLRKKPEEERHKLLTELPPHVTTLFLSLTAHQTYTNAFLLHLTEALRSKTLEQLPPVIQCSFLNLPENQDYSIHYLQQLTEDHFSKLVAHLPEGLIQTTLEQKKGKQKKEALNKYLNEAIASLTQLNEKLKREQTLLSPWLESYKNHSFYPFPLLFAAKLESHPHCAARADPDLWNRFMELGQSCSQKLTRLGLGWDEEELQRSIQARATQVLSIALKANNIFFKNLFIKLQNPSTETSEITRSLEEQKQTPAYSYPFYTQIRVLKILQLLTKEPAKLQPFADTLSTCQNLLLSRKIESFKTEKPPKDHEGIKDLELAMDQLENISRLQALLKDQLSSTLTTTR